MPHHCLAAASATRPGGTLPLTRLICAASVLAALAACTSFREGSRDIAVGPPPPPLAETPVPRPGYVWAPGYWGWEGNTHAWVEGHWMPARSGEHWVPDQWERESGRWHFEPGHWAQGAGTLGTTAALR